MNRNQRRTDRVRSEALASSFVVDAVRAMEAVLLALICLSPWAYGAVHPGFEFLLDVGIVLLLTLWVARMLLEGQLVWKHSTVAICLAGLFLLGIWQCTSLSGPVMAWLSPGTAQCYGQLLPEQRETLPNDAADSGTASRPGSTLSLYPGATRREAGRYLSVFLVFAVVYNNLTSKQTLIRLSWVALLNGSLLSLFALFQFFAAPTNTVYWTLTSLGKPFGPFICRNHFPDYVNMCIGLGIGLLLSRSRRSHASAAEEENVSPLQLLRDPRALGICGALGLMITAVVFSRSRGGMLALVGTAVLCGIVGRLRLGDTLRFGPILVVSAVVLALSAWFGLDLIKERLATIETGEAFESRVPLWVRSLSIPKGFPIWGTGYGTFGYVEPMYRQNSPTAELLAWYDHAHNDYLEILVEGGVVGLCLVVLALVAVYRRALRAVAMHRGSRRAGLVLGAFFAFTALALHSFADFGTHIPAITLLGTVVCAQLCALGQSRQDHARSVHDDSNLPHLSARYPANSGTDADSDTYRLGLGGLAPVLGGFLILTFGVVICGDSWKAHRTDRLESAAYQAGNDDSEQLLSRIAFLTDAVSLSPENASLHYELGSAHERLAELLMSGSTPNLRGALEQRMMALREHLRARDACPLLSRAQAGVAAYAPVLKQGDKAEVYLHRAKLLSPGQVEMWYVCGLRELMLNRTQDAYASWRHCLALSDQFLPQILRLSMGLSTDKLLEQILPDNPEVLLTAAVSLYPEFGSVERRRPFLVKALRLLESKEEEPGARDLLAKARIYKALEQPDQAIPLYRELLKRDRSQVRLRSEFAGYLHDVRKLDEAHRELKVIVALDPKNGTAQELLEAVSQEMAQEKSQERKRQRDEWWIRHQRR